jgi:hypothetical protein
MRIQFNHSCIAAMLFFCAHPDLRAEIFTYVDPASGVTLMSNVSPTVNQQIENSKRISNHGRVSQAGSAVRPVNFPTVSPQTQKERDNDRRAILRKELKTNSVVPMSRLCVRNLSVYCIGTSKTLQH